MEIAFSNKMNPQGIKIKSIRTIAFIGGFIVNLFFGGLKMGIIKTKAYFVGWMGENKK